MVSLGMCPTLIFHGGFRLPPASFARAPRTTPGGAPAPLRHLP